MKTLTYIILALTLFTLTACSSVRLIDTKPLEAKHEITKVTIIDNDMVEQHNKLNIYIQDRLRKVVTKVI